MPTKVVFCWSGGKDSALALHRLRQDPRYQIVSLLTTCNQHFQRVSMHGVRCELLERQARALELPLEMIFLSERSSNDEYQEKMTASLREHLRQGVTACAFGDIFLEDLKQWRDANLASIGMEGVYPIWKEDTRALMREFFASGFGTVICCVNDAYFDDQTVGRELDEKFVAALPATVDPCGENGEFHTFAFAGPVFSAPIAYTSGEKVYRPLEEKLTPQPGRPVTKGFWFCDLLPAEK